MTLSTHKRSLHSKLLMGDTSSLFSRRHVSPLKLLEYSTGSLTPSPIQSPSDDINKETSVELKACELTYNYLNYKVNNIPSNTKDKVLETLVIIGDELIIKHQIVVNAVCKRLRYAQPNSNISFNNELFLTVCNELYKDKNDNWGRIVTVFVLGAIIAQNDKDETGGANFDDIALFVGEYLAKNKSTWISNNGGWEGFVKFFNKAHDDSRVWKGLMCLGAMGALAGIAATR